MTKPLQPLVLEDEPIWVEANSLAEYMYNKLHELPEDEKWDTTAKLRTAANSLMYSVGEALGDAAPSNMEYNWGAARRFVSALKTMYRFACRQKFIDLEPAIMVRLDALLKMIDEKVSYAYAQTAAKNKADFDLWHKKFRLSQGAERED